MKNVYKVKFETELYVSALDIFNAETIAKMNLNGAMKNCNVKYVKPIYFTEDIPKGLEDHCPCGGNETIAEILKDR